MQNLADSITTIETESNDAIQTATTLTELERIRSEFLGKKGKIPALFPLLQQQSLEDKKKYGPLINGLKKTVETALENKMHVLAEAKIAAAQAKMEHFDVSAYETDRTYGHLHPYTHALETIETIFASMGFSIEHGPVMENDYHNFTALNIPENHPARDMYDTFWIDRPHTLLRTHTSPVQARILADTRPPLAVFSAGRVFRHEATDASHDFMFLQGEGLLVDTNITLEHLFGVAQSFLRAFFQKDELDIRIRPGFFPFVEPGVEIDMQCPFCNDGCSVCKKSRWIEIFPGGIVHPKVLTNAGIDPNIYSGFAFGFGLTRLVMLKYQIPDIRLLHHGDIRFLHQF